MSILISDEIFHATRLTAVELTQELAVALFQREKLTLGQASQLAAMNQWQFQQLLASRQIPVIMTSRISRRIGKPLMNGATL